MIEYEFKDINHCPTCYGEGELVFTGASFDALRKIAIDNNTYMKRHNVMCCPKCKGTGKCLNELELEQITMSEGIKNDRSRIKRVSKIYH